jgi:hypothetical protein
MHAARRDPTCEEMQYMPSKRAKKKIVVALAQRNEDERKLDLLVMMLYA